MPGLHNLVGCDKVARPAASLAGILVEEQILGHAFHLVTMCCEVLHCFRLQHVGTCVSVLTMLTWEGRAGRQYLLLPLWSKVLTCLCAVYLG